MKRNCTLHYTRARKVYMASIIVYLRDHGGQVVTTGIPVQVTATTPERQALVDAIQLWSIGENDGADNVVELEARIGNGANSPIAQSGVYAYVQMQDNITGRTYKERIPMPDLTKAVDVGTNIAWQASVELSGQTISVANPLHADYIALKAAFEAAYVSPAGNTAQMTRLYVPNRL
jgi:hypothetical protein